jgi:hypothetical protein
MTIKRLALAAIICEDYGIEPGELTDEMLENISSA